MLTTAQIEVLRSVIRNNDDVYEDTARTALELAAAYSRVAVLIDELECEYGDDCPDFRARHGRCLPCKLRRALEGP
jgi:hypothetical protein